MSVTVKSRRGGRGVPLDGPPGVDGDEAKLDASLLQANARDGYRLRRGRTDTVSHTSASPTPKTGSSPDH
jgi:hypothetical protein